MRYTAEVGGHQWSRGPTADVDTLTDASAFASAFNEGAGADVLKVTR